MGNSYSPPNYLVTWNCDDSELPFETFAEALEEYKKHCRDRFGCRVWGKYPDDTSSGLTEAEEDAIAEVDEQTVAFLEVG